jgi:intein/homing endonuclease
MENIHCVAPETLILTDSGYHQISDLQDKKVEIWNGYEYSSVIVRQTSPRSKLLRVELDNGKHLWCTENHKWLLLDGDARKQKHKVNISLYIFFN